MNRDEFIAWQHYYSQPRDEELTHLYIAQMTAVSSNAWGAKNKTQNFIFDFSHKEQSKNIDETKQSAKSSKARLLQHIKGEL